MRSIINQQQEDLRIARRQESPPTGVVRMLKLKAPIKRGQLSTEPAPPSYILEVLVPGDDAIPNEPASYFKFIGAKVIKCEDHMTPDSIRQAVERTLKSKKVGMRKDDIDVQYKISKLHRPGTFHFSKDMEDVLEWVGHINAMGLNAVLKDKESPTLRAYAYKRENRGGPAPIAFFCTDD